MKGVQGSLDIVDAFAAQSEGFSEVVNLQTKWKNGTSRNATNNDVIRDHQRRSTNLLALVSKYCTYLSLSASLGLFARCCFVSPSGFSRACKIICRIRNLTLESNWLVQMIQREIENGQVARS